MNNINIKVVKELFARLFVLGIHNKMNFLAFTKAVEKSEFVRKIEDGQFDDYFNTPLEKIFFDITKREIDKDISFGIFDDAYWCGYSYFELHQKTKKSFAFIFLKLPLSKMMDIYSIYHEMDFSSLFNYFQKIDEEKTLLRLLCEEKNCSITKLSLKTGISKATLSKYNASDEALYKASFQNIYKIVMYFDVPFVLFYALT